MTLEDIKVGIQQLSGEDRLYLQGYISHLARVDTEQNRSELSKALAEMDMGKKLSRQELLSAHDNLKSQGK